MPEPQHIGPEFLFTAAGRVKTVEQGTPECTAARVFHVAVSPEGFREDSPSFGVPELAFERVPLDLRAFEAAILRSEPEATLSSIERAYSKVTSQREVQIEVGN